MALSSAGGIAVVVLGRHEHERVGRVDGGAPGLGVRVLVLAEARVLRLVEQGEIDLPQIDQLRLELAVRRARSTTHSAIGMTLTRPSRVLAKMTCSFTMNVSAGGSKPF